MEPRIISNDEFKDMLKDAQKEGIEISADDEEFFLGNSSQNLDDDDYFDD